MAFLTEDRKGQGLILIHNIIFNTTLVGLKQYARGTVLNLKKANRDAEQIVKELQVRPLIMNRPTRQLSGGNQQKVVIAKWLLSKSSIFIFDEPTRGIDVGAKVEVYNLINQLVAEGACVIMISSELPEILGMSDRILADTDAPWDSKVSFVGTGNLAGGKQGGEYLAKKLGKDAKVAVLRGALGDPTHDERANGAKEALEAAGVKVVTIQPANSDRAMAMSVMENILQATPDVQGVFATNDEMALGALQALAAKKKQIPVVGFDGSPDALKSIAEGKLDASVAQSPFNIGKMSVEAAVKAAKGEPVEKRIDTGTEIINKDNVAQKQAELDKILKK